MQALKSRPAPKVRPGPVAHSTRRHAQAEADYRQGLALAKQDRWRDAEASFASAVHHNPDDAVFWLNLAHARVKLGDLEHGADAARQAARIDPQSELAVSIASQCLAAGNRHEEIIELLQGLDLGTAKEPNPFMSLGDAHMGLHKYQDAINAYLEALKRKPDFVPAYVHLSNAFEHAHMYLEARECLKTAVALGSGQVNLHAAMAHSALHACRFDLVEEDIGSLAAARTGGTGDPVPFHLLTLPSSAAEQRQAGLTYWMERCAALEPMPRPPSRGSRRQLRIGYVSSDIHRHATAFLIADLIESHDRQRTAVFVYSYGRDDGSPIRRRIVEAAGPGFVDAVKMSDKELAARIRADDIDILVDLKGYTQGTRLGICALRPARVQVNFLGYPGTMAAPCYDYIVGDRWVTPLADAADFSEKIAQMPHCYQPNDRKRAIGPRPTRAECGLPETGFVFSCFNSCYKITPPVFDIWCRLLREVEGSVLWLLEANGQARPNLTREAQQRGVDPSRIIWAPSTDLAAHLGRIQLADLFLDTLPVNAHTTASDALWAGLPLLTRVGDTFVSRVAASILEAAGVPELVTHSAEEYEALALALARDPARLAGIRERIESRGHESPLFDTVAYTHALEDLYDRMMGRWDRDLPADHLPVLAPA